MKSRFEILIQKIKDNDASLTKLYLTFTKKVSCDQIFPLCDALKMSTMLKSIKLEWDEINEDGLTAISEMLKINTGISSLDLTYNRLTDFDIQTICQGIKVNSTLTNISFTNREDFGALAINSIHEMLESNFTLLNIGFYPKTNLINSALERNWLINETEKLLSTFRNTLFIDTKNIARIIVKLENMGYKYSNNSLNDNNYLAECYRVLNALAYMSKKSKEAKSEACRYLLNPFDFQKLQHHADFLLSHIFSDEIFPKEEKLQNKNRCLIVLHGLRNHLSKTECKYLAYNALYSLINDGKSLSIAEFDNFKNEHVIISYPDLVNLAREVLIDVQKNNSNPSEDLVLKIVISSKEYNPEITHFLFQSPTFINEFKRRYPKAVYFTLPEHCLLMQEYRFKIPGNIQITSYPLSMSSSNQKAESIDNIKHQLHEYLFQSVSDDSNLKQVDISPSITQPCGKSTPLHEAARKNNTELCLKLIKEGEDVNAIDEKENTPIFIACRNNYYDLAKLLIEHGADLNKKCPNATPLYIACQYGYSSLVYFLLKTGKLDNIDETCIRQHTSLQVSCLSPHTNEGLLFTWLLEHGASLTHKNDQGQTAIEIALERFHDTAIGSILRFVHKNNLNPGTIMSTESYKLAMEWLQDHKQVKLITYFKWHHFLSHPSSIQDIELHNLTENEIDLFIIECFKNENLIILEKLLSLNKVDVGLLVLISDEYKTFRPSQFNSRLNGVYDNSKRLLPLLHLAIDKWPEAFPLLLKCGASINSTDYYPKWVKKHYGTSIISNYYEFFANGRTPLHTAIIKGNIEIMGLLLKHGAAPNAVDEEGLTTLHMAALNNYPEAIKLLIEKSADKNCIFESKDKFGMSTKSSTLRVTPLIIAMHSNNIEAVLALLSQGCDIKPALEWACDNKNLQMLKILISSPKCHLETQEIHDFIKSTEKKDIQNCFKARLAWNQVRFFAHNSQLSYEINNAIAAKVGEIYLSELKSSVI